MERRQARAQANACSYFSRAYSTYSSTCSSNLLTHLVAPFTHSRTRSNYLHAHLLHQPPLELARLRLRPPVGQCAALVVEAACAPQ